MEAILFPFGSVSEVKSAAEVALKVGDLCVYRSPFSGQEMGGRVKDILHDGAHVLFRETKPRVSPL